MPLWLARAGVGWLVFYAVVGEWLNRTAYKVVHGSSLWRWNWLPPAVVGFVFVLCGIWGNLRRFEVYNRVHNVYPLHLAWAAERQNASRKFMRETE